MSFKAHTLEERIEELGLKPDRADVIIPASEICLKILKAADIRNMYVPQVGTLLWNNTSFI